MLQQNSIINQLPPALAGGIRVDFSQITPQTIGLKPSTRYIINPWLKLGAIEKS